MTLTYKQKFNKKYGFEKDTSHSLNEISKLTGYKLSGLKTILSKGEGAYYTNPSSVRKHIASAREWGMARVYSAVMGGKASQVDSHALIKNKIQQRVNRYREQGEVIPKKGIQKKHKSEYEK